MLYSLKRNPSDWPFGAQVHRLAPVLWCQVLHIARKPLVGVANSLLEFREFGNDLGIGREVRRCGTEEACPEQLLDSDQVVELLPCERDGSGKLVAVKAGYRIQCALVSPLLVIERFDQHVIPPTNHQPVITPPPRHTSPLYSTADWPGVTAHCGSGKRRLKVSAFAPSARVQGASSWR